MNFSSTEICDEARDRLFRRFEPLPAPADKYAALAAAIGGLADLDIPTVAQLLSFGSSPTAAGAILVENLPVDAEPGATPTDGAPSLTKPTYVAEYVLLMLSLALGRPVGYATEKDGRLIHDVVPVATGASTQTNQGSRVFLRYHNDIAYDPSGDYSRASPDFLVLNCLRADAKGEAVTYFADARDILATLSPSALSSLRACEFRLNAPGSYVRDCNGGRPAYSAPTPIIAGPSTSPSITLSANGVEPQTESAAAALSELNGVFDEVCHQVSLAPGQALVLSNRKGVHARSQFVAQHDGKDRWLQRTYVRSAVWDIRGRMGPPEIIN